MPAWLGPAIAAGASLIGGVLGSSSDASQAQKNREQQREFAQHGIRWRVADARAAGIHPLYALGANVPSYSPVYHSGGRTLAQGVAAGGRGAGQAVSRAQGAQMAREQHAANIETQRAQAMAARASAARDFVAASAASSVGNRAAQAQGVRGDRTLLGTVGEGYVPGPQSPAQRWEDEYGDAAFIDALTLRTIDALRRSGEWAFGSVHRRMPKRLQTRKPRRLPPLPYQLGY